MSIVNMLEAKTHLSRLVEEVESGATSEMIIARNGKPAARLVPIGAPAQVGKRLGLLRRGSIRHLHKRNSTLGTKRSLAFFEATSEDIVGHADCDLGADRHKAVERAAPR